MDLGLTTSRWAVGGLGRQMYRRLRRLPRALGRRHGLDSFFGAGIAREIAPSEPLAGDGLSSAQSLAAWRPRMRAKFTSAARPGSLERATGDFRWMNGRSFMTAKVGR
jgi:hypothetical protein